MGSHGELERAPGAAEAATLYECCVHCTHGSGMPEDEHTRPCQYGCNDGEPEGAHACTPIDGSAYSMAGPNTGQPANLAREQDHPVEAVCTCGRVIRRESPVQPGWARTGRLAGDPR